MGPHKTLNQCLVVIGASIVYRSHEILSVVEQLATFACMIIINIKNFIIIYLMYIVIYLNSDKL